MTKQEFETTFANKSHITVDELHKQGLVAVPCDCECEEEPHWRMDVKPLTLIREKL